MVKAGMEWHCATDADSKYDQYHLSMIGNDGKCGERPVTPK